MLIRLVPVLEHAAGTRASSATIVMRDTFDLQFM